MAKCGETWPKNIVASVLLKNNKIISWQVSKCSLKVSSTNVGRLVALFPREYSYEEEQWIVNDNEEHSEVYNKKATDWLKRWKIHENFKGESPFDGEYVEYVEPDNVINWDCIIIALEEKLQRLKEQRVICQCIEGYENRKENLEAEVLKYEKEYKKVLRKQKAKL